MIRILKIVPTTYLLAVVFCLALGLRLLGMFYGLPFGLHVDEYHEVMRALQLGTGSFNIERIGKGGLYILLFLEYAVYFSVNWVLGVVDTAREFGEAFVKDPTVFYALGRATVAVIGALGVYAIYLVGRDAYGSLVGLAAAGFLCINSLHVDLSRVIGLDAVLVTLCGFSFYFCLRLMRSGARSDYIFSCIFIALATTTKISGVLLVISFLISHIFYWQSRRDHPLLSRELLTGAAIGGVLLFVTNPGIIFAWRFLSLFTPAAPISNEADLDSRLAYLPGDTQDLNHFYLSALISNLGWPLFLLCSVGLATAIVKRTKQDIVLISFILPYYLAITSTTSDLYYPRYALPVIFILLLFGSRAFKVGLEIVPFDRRKALFIPLFFIFSYSSLAGVVHSTRMVLSEDTRIDARKWILEHIPKSHMILIEGSKLGVARNTVPLPESTQSLRDKIEYWKDTEKKQAVFLEYVLSANQEEGYDFVFLRPGSVYSLDDYLNDGVTVFVLRPDAILHERSKLGEPARQLLRELRARHEVTLAYRAQGVNHPTLSPTVEVYVSSSPIFDKMLK